MRNKLSIKNTGNILGIISITIPLIGFLFIFNWFFKITPFQKYQGLPLLIAPFIGLIGLGLCFISSIISSNKFAKIGFISNIILLALPFLYQFLGTIIEGV